MMENKEIFFQACDRMLKNQAFDWSLFYDPDDEYALSVPHSCNTTGCLMHEYTRLDKNFFFGSGSVHYKNDKKGNVLMGRVAFSTYHKLSLTIATVIVCQDPFSFDQLNDQYFLWDQPGYQKAEDIMHTKMCNVSARQALFLFLFVLVNTGNLTEEEIPENLLIASENTF